LTRLLLTGASGLVGTGLLRYARDRKDLQWAAAVRRPRNLPGCERVHVTPALDAAGDWRDALVGVDVVVHAAARVHVMDETASDPLAEFRKANVEGTLALARQAVEAGVRRFVFISSIKVNGEASEPGQPFTADDPARPVDPYGISKQEAEQALRELAQASGMEVVIIRPVLVYGPGVKANFQRMMRWLCAGVPLPFAAIDNRRSLVALDNLADLIITCAEHPAAANQTFLASDGEDLSTAQLLRRLGAALGRPARLLPVPASLLLGVAGCLGRRKMAQRLCGSLQVDITKNHALLNWKPVVSVDQAFQQTARHYLDKR
jgi:UDP-glucose 4-epimerase